VSARGERGGFTLIEIVAGLALVGALFAGIVALLDSATDGRDRIVREAEDADRIANGERLLTSMLANADVVTDSASRFIGDEGEASFNSWCIVPQGWLEHCRVWLRVSDRLGGSDVSWVVGNDTRLLRHFVVPVQFRYYGVVGAEQQWLNQWGRSIALPDAIALVAEGDTTVISGLGRQ
jgi:prepilin-type N-terminal cleavage/methylation domain-containing protein